MNSMTSKTGWFRSMSVLLAAALWLSATVASAGDVEVTLSGDQEVPPVTTAATGRGTIEIGDDGSISGSITTAGVAGTMAHVHLAAPGKNGPPIITLTKGADDEWAIPAGARLTDAQYENFKAGGLYINVHSATNPGGEIRGQLKPR